MRENDPVAASSVDFARMHIATNDLPDSERTPFMREVFARQMCRLEFEPLSEGALDVDATLVALPGMSVGWCVSPIAARWSRTGDLVKDGDDTVSIIMPLAGTVRRSQRGQELDAVPGEGVCVLHSEPGSIEFRQLDDLALMVPRSALASLVPDLEAAATRVIAHDALRLLKTYLMPWRDDFHLADPAACRLAITHVSDLVALALGAGRDAAEVARGRGVRAARLKAVKADIAAHLTARDLSVSAVALRQSVSPRYIHMLFEDEGTTFSQFVLTERLALAHRFLSDPRRADPSISAIAYASGFGDLSHFNHAFRRRYGATPSDVRRKHAE